MQSEAEEAVSLFPRWLKRHGYWRRWKERIWSRADGRMWPSVGYRVALLLRFDTATRYKPRFGYGKAVEAAAFVNLSGKKFRKTPKNALKK